MIEHFKLTLAESWMLAPSVRHLAFERSDGQALACKPGQFLQVHFHYADGTPTKRSYSVVTRFAEGEQAVQRVEMAVSYVEGGAATKLFAGLQPGDEIEASGPFGRFCLPDDAGEHGRYLLLATGTGVAPYRAMLGRIAELMRDDGREFVLLQGARNPGELLYGEEFAAFATAHPAFRYHPCLSREPRAQPRAGDRRGHVQDVLAEIAPDAERDMAFLCGNPDMIDDGFEALKACGLPVRQIRREKYVSSR